MTFKSSTARHLEETLFQPSVISNVNKRQKILWAYIPLALITATDAILSDGAFRTSMKDYKGLMEVVNFPLTIFGKNFLLQLIVHSYTLSAS